MTLLVEKRMGSVCRRLSVSKLPLLCAHMFSGGEKGFPKWSNGGMGLIWGRKCHWNLALFYSWTSTSHNPRNFTQKWHIIRGKCFSLGGCFNKTTVQRRPRKQLKTLWKLFKGGGREFFSKMQIVRMDFDHVSLDERTQAVSVPRYGEQIWTGYWSQERLVQRPKFGDDLLPRHTDVVTKKEEKIAFRLILIRKLSGKIWKISRKWPKVPGRGLSTGGRRLFLSDKR